MSNSCGTSAANIRATYKSDIPAVIAFINASWVRTYAPLIGEAAAQELATTKHMPELFSREIEASHALSFIAEKDGGRIIAHVGGFQKGDGVLFLDRFHVAPDWHGRGIALNLMHAAEIDATTKGFKQLELTVLEGNGRAMSFYEKAGFERDLSSQKREGMGGRHAVAYRKQI